MIAQLVTGDSCNDPTGDCPKVNLLKRSSSESWQGPRVGWSLTTSKALDTQVAQIARSDHWRLLYRSEVIVIAEVMTGATCNDPNGDCPKVNSFKKSSSESWQGPRVGWPLITSLVLGTQVAHLSCDDY